jgi:hypothetical protein
VSLGTGAPEIKYTECTGCCGGFVQVGLAWASGLGAGAGIQGLASRMAAAGFPVRMRLRGCPRVGVQRDAGGAAAVLSTLRIPPWGLCLLPEIGNPCSLQLLPPRPARGVHAGAAAAGPVGAAAGRRRGRSVLAAPALAGGVLYEAQDNTPGIKPQYYPRE